MTTEPHVKEMALREADVDEESDRGTEGDA